MEANSSQIRKEEGNSRENEDEFDNEVVKLWRGEALEEIGASNSRIR